MGILYIQEAYEFYTRNFQKKFGFPKGCSFEEIRGLEHDFGYVFPDAYREFLSWMGKDHRGVFCGSDWYSKDIKGNTEYLPDLLDDNGITWDSTNLLVFFCHQGYMAAWFNLPKEDEDPLVGFFSEGTTGEPIIQGTFSKFLLNELVMYSQNS